jgi:alcohol dehydrogenase, propanol-preferring
VVLDFVGSDSSLRLAADIAGVSAEISLIGGAGGTLPVSHGSVPREARVTRTGMGSLPELYEVVALAEKYHIMPEVDGVYAPNEAADVYACLDRGEIRGRAVIGMQQR